MLVPCLVALALAGCGGESYSGADEGQKAAENPTCPPREARLTEAPRKRATVGRPVRVDLSEASGGIAGRVQITVRGATTPAGVDDAFTKKGRFGTAAGDRFLAVDFALENKGGRRIEAANSVNEAFVIADGGGRAWLRADGVENCSAISPSAATGAGATSPEDDVDPGKGYDTMSVYVVPRNAKRLSWVGPGVRFPLKPR